MATMKAVRMHSYGGPDVLVYEDAPRPETGEGEVFVRVHVAGVNPLDWKIREGQMKSMIDYQLPLILGLDISGVVEAVGPGARPYRRDKTFTGCWISTAPGRMRSMPWGTPRRSPPNQTRSTTFKRRPFP